ncbi:MAG: DUF5367 family protein [Proteobacteria bacterium]|nr:DUF5367 family protein [Pseudomonadota bacterium]
MVFRWLIVGVVLWAIVTAAFRFAGQMVFTPGNGVMTLFLVLPLIIFALTFVLIKITGVGPADRAEAASIFAVPGLFFGIYEVNNFSTIFPNLDANLGSTFAALMFACFAAVVISGIVSSRLQQLER